MNSLVIGMGQIGVAVKAVTRSEYSYDSSDKKIPKIKDLDVMHICFPYSDMMSFVPEVKKYISTFKPKHVVVWSTVHVGTCRAIDEEIVHSPVEGVHPNLKYSILQSRRWVGYNNGEEGRFFVKYFNDLGLSCWMVSDTETTELAKLRSTSKYGINLVWAEYESELCKKFDVAFSNLMAYDKDYNELYQRLDPNAQRYVLYPPNGEIGGHCVVPNAKLLAEQAPSDLLNKIIAMEKK